MLKVLYKRSLFRFSCWRGVLACLCGLLVWLLARPVQALELSETERQWLAAHPQIRYGVEQAYGPFIFVGADGQPQGLSIDLLQRIGQRLGVAFVPTATAPLSGLLALAQRRELDVLTSLRPTPERAQYLAFTHPYFNSPTHLFLRQQESGPIDLNDLTGFKVAVGQGFAVEAFVRAHYPAVDWLAVASDEEAFRLLRAGQVAAVVADRASSRFLAWQHGWQDLHVGPAVGFEYPLSLASRNDWPELGALLNRALTDLSFDEREQLMRPWLERARELPAVQPYPIPLLLAMLMGLLALGLWLRLYWQRWR